MFVYIRDLGEEGSPTTLKMVSPPHPLKMILHLLNGNENLLKFVVMKKIPPGH